MPSSKHFSDKRLVEAVKFFFDDGHCAETQGEAELHQMLTGLHFKKYLLITRQNGLPPLYSRQLANKDYDTSATR